MVWSEWNPILAILGTGTGHSKRKAQPLKHGHPVGFVRGRSRGTKTPKMKSIPESRCRALIQPSITSLNFQNLAASTLNCGRFLDLAKPKTCPPSCRCSGLAYGRMCGASPVAAASGLSGTLRPDASVCVCVAQECWDCSQKLQVAACRSICLCIYIYVHTRIYRYTYICMHTCACVCMYTCKCTHRCIYM